MPSCCTPQLDAPACSRVNVRYRLCPTHLRATVVMLDDGRAVRFCQKCSSLQPLHEFRGAQRTCARQLDAQVARRRGGGSGAPHALLPQVLTPSEPIPLSEQGVSAGAQDVTALYGEMALLEEILQFGSDDAGSTAHVLPPDAAPVRVQVVVKLHDCGLPEHLSAAMAPALRSWLATAPYAAEGHITPGCVLLTVDALVSARDAAAMQLPHGAAADAAGSLLASPCSSFLRGGAWSVRVGAGSAARFARGGRTARGGAPEAPPPPQPVSVRPLAMLSTCDSVLELRLSAPAARPLAPTVRCGGRTVATAGDASWDRSGQTLRFTLPATGAEGVAYAALEAAPDAAPGASGAPGPGLARPMVLTPHPGIAAELAVGLAVRAAATSEDAAASVAAAIGTAMRQGANPQLVRAAVLIALDAGWMLTARRLMDCLWDAAAAADAAAERQARAARVRLTVLTALLCAALGALLHFWVAPTLFTVGYVDTAAASASARLSVAGFAAAAVAGVAAVLHAASLRVASPAATETAQRQGAAAVSERQLVAWLASSQRTTVMCIAVLHMLHMPTLLAPRVAAAASADAAWAGLGLVARHLVSTTRVLSVTTGAGIAAEALPWPLVQAAASWLAASAWLLRFPANALLLAAAAAPASIPRLRALYERHFETLYLVAALGEMLHVPITEYLFLYRRGAVVLDYSWAVALQYSVVSCILIICSRWGTFGPCRTRANAVVLAARTPLFVGCIGLVPRLWPTALRSPHIIVQTSIVLASAVMLRSTGAKMRALCARQLMPATKGKQL